MSISNLSTPSVRLSNPPTLIKYGNMKFLVMDAPSDSVLPLYIKEMQKHNVTDLVRVCHPTYSKQRLEELSIKVHDWPFEDGEPPPNNIIDEWLLLVGKTFKQEVSTPSTVPTSTTPASSDDGCCIATHCVAGLGRAPVLVAIALIEDGMSALDSVAFIRERRRGAINNKQLKFLENYKRRRKSKQRNPVNFSSNNMDYTYWQVGLLWSFMAMGIFGLVYYYANRNAPYYVYASVFFGWLFPFSMVLLLPLDITSNLYLECLKTQQTCSPPALYVSQGFLLYAWRTIYWTMFILTFFVVPFIIAYCDSGYFTFIDKAKKSLRANFIYYGILFAIGVVALFYIIVTNRFKQREAILQFSMSAANIYGLGFLVVFLAYGLAEIPRSFWHQGNRRRSLRYLEFKAPQIKDALHTAQAEYDTLAKEIHAISDNTSFDNPLRPFVDIVVSKAPLDPTTGPVGPLPSQYRDLEMSQLTELHKNIIRAVREKERWEWEWSNLCRDAFHLQDILTYANDHSMYDLKKVVWLIDRKFYSSVQKPYEGFLATIMPGLEWMWYVKLEPIVYKFLAFIASLLSISIIWSEATYLIHNPVISAIGAIFNIPDVSYVLVEILSVIVMLYMCLCATHALFRVKIFNMYSIHPNHHTTEVSLCWFTNQMCRLTFPLGYNFMYLASRTQTSLFRFMGEMVGAGLQTFVPILVVVIVLMNLFNVMTRIAGCLGFTDKFMDEDDKDAGWGDAEEGKILLSEARGLFTRENETSVNLRREASSSLLTKSDAESGGEHEKPKRAHKDLSKTTSKYLLNNPLYAKYQNKNQKSESSPLVHNEGESSSGTGTGENRSTLGSKNTTKELNFDDW